jgi:hypothetical protein
MAERKLTAFELETRIISWKELECSGNYMRLAELKNTNLRNWNRIWISDFD